MAEYQALYEVAGFHVTGILPTRETASVIEGVIA
jgi:hypothetical protein